MKWQKNKENNYIKKLPYHNLIIGQNNSKTIKMNKYNTLNKNSQKMKTQLLE